MSIKFEREDRYYVFKISDIEATGMTDIIPLLDTVKMITDLNRGAFKFVLAKDKTLYIGFAHSDYHMDICGNLDRYQIRSAGYLAYDGVEEGEEDNEKHIWFANGKSEGYGIGCRPDDGLEIRRYLMTLSDSDIVEQMNDNARLAIKIA